MPANSDGIAQIKQVKQFKTLVAKHIFARINLYSLARALQVRKTRFAHQAIADDASRDAYLMLVGFEFWRCCGRIFLDDAGRRLGPAKFARKRIDSQRSDLLEFL